MTALRLVSRMKRDYIHTGRRPSGLCGAALLIAARLHEFGRTVGDIIKIVKVHESTLRKRLVEFGDTPSSSLTLDEFMSVDLEEEQDPPSFKNARRKDKERLQKMMEEEDVNSHFSELQKEIEKQLEEKRICKRRKKILIAESDEADKETQEAESFIVQSTLGAIEGCLANNTTEQNEEVTQTLNNPTSSLGLGPNIASMGLASSLDDCTEIQMATKSTEENGEIDLDGLDDDEIDSYIMSENEAKYKDSLWMKINAVYLKEQKEKEEKLAKEKEEGKPEKKKRRTSRKPKSNLAANTPGEAIEKMLQEKKISSKINYDVLKSLNVKEASASGATSPNKRLVEVSPALEQLETRQSSEVIMPKLEGSPTKSVKLSRATPQVKITARKSKVDTVAETPVIMEQVPAQVELEPDEGDEFEDEPEPEPDHNELSLSQMLNHHRDDDTYYGDDYYDDY